MYQQSRISVFAILGLVFVFICTNAQAYKLLRNKKRQFIPSSSPVQISQWKGPFFSEEEQNTAFQELLQGGVNIDGVFKREKHPRPRRPTDVDQNKHVVPENYQSGAHVEKIDFDPNKLFSPDMHKPSALVEKMDFDPNKLFNPEIQKPSTRVHKHEGPPEAETYLGVLPKGAEEDDDAISPQEKLAHLISKPIIEDAVPDIFGGAGGSNDHGRLNGRNLHGGGRRFDDNNDREGGSRNDDDNDGKRHRFHDNDGRHFHDDEGRFHDDGHRFQGHGPRFGYRQHSHGSNGGEHRHGNDRGRFHDDVEDNRNFNNADKDERGFQEDSDNSREDDRDRESYESRNHHVKQHHHQPFHSYHDGDGNFVSHNVDNRDDKNGRDRDDGDDDDDTNKREGLGGRMVQREHQEDRTSYFLTHSDDHQGRNKHRWGNVDDDVIYRLSHSIAKKSNIPVKESAAGKTGTAKLVAKKSSIVSLKSRNTQKKKNIVVDLNTFKRSRNAWKPLGIAKRTRKTEIPQHAKTAKVTSKNAESLAKRTIENAKIPTKQTKENTENMTKKTSKTAGNMSKRTGAAKRSKQNPNTLNRKLLSEATLKSATTTATVAPKTSMISKQIQNTTTTLNARNSTLKKSVLPIAPLNDVLDPEISKNTLISESAYDGSQLGIPRTSILENVHVFSRADHNSMSMPSPPHELINGDNGEAFGPQFSEPYHGGHNSGNQGYSKGEYFGPDVPDEQDDSHMAPDKDALQHSLEKSLDHETVGLIDDLVHNSEGVGGDDDVGRHHGGHGAPTNVVNFYSASPDSVEGIEGGHSARVMLPEETFDGFQQDTHDSSHGHHEEEEVHSQHNVPAIARHHPDSVQQQAIQSIQDDMNIDDELEIAGVGVPVKNRHPTRRVMHDHNDEEIPIDLMELEHHHDSDHHFENDYHHDTPHNENSYEVPASYGHEHSSDSVPLHSPHNFGTHKDHSHQYHDSEETFEPSSHDQNLHEEGPTSNAHEDGLDSVPLHSPHNFGTHSEHPHSSNSPEKTSESRTHDPNSHDEDPISHEADPLSHEEAAPSHDDHVPEFPNDNPPTEDHDETNGDTGGMHDTVDHGDRFENGFKDHEGGDGGGETDQGHNDVAGHGHGEFGHGLPLIAIPNQHEMSPEEYGKQLDDVMARFSPFEHHPMWAPDHHGGKGRNGGAGFHLNRNQGASAHGVAPHGNSHSNPPAHTAVAPALETHLSPHYEQDDGPGGNQGDEEEHGFSENLFPPSLEPPDKEHVEGPPYEYLPHEDGGKFKDEYNANEFGDNPPEGDEDHHNLLPAISLRLSKAPTGDMGGPQGVPQGSAPPAVPQGNNMAEGPQAGMPAATGSQGNIPAGGAQGGGVKGVQEGQGPANGMQGNGPGNAQGGGAQGNGLGNGATGGFQGGGGKQGNIPMGGAIQGKARMDAHHRSSGKQLGPKPLNPQKVPPIPLKSINPANHQPMRRPVPEELQHQQLPPIDIHHSPVAHHAPFHAPVHPAGHAIHPTIGNAAHGINSHPLQIQGQQIGRQAGLMGAPGPYASIGGLESSKSTGISKTGDVVNSANAAATGNQQVPGSLTAGNQQGNAAGLGDVRSPDTVTAVPTNTQAITMHSFSKHHIEDCCMRNDDTCCAKALPSPSPLMNEGDQASLLIEKSRSSTLTQGATSDTKDKAFPSSRFKDIINAYKMMNLTVPADLEIAELKAELREIKSKQRIGDTKSKTPQNSRVEKGTSKDKTEGEDHKEPEQAKAPNGAAEVTKLIQEMGSRAVAADFSYASRFQRLQQLNLEQQSLLKKMLEETAGILNKKPKKLKKEDPEQYTVETILNLGHETDPGVQEAQLISILRQMQRAAGDATANYWDSLKNRKHPKANANVNYFVTSSNKDGAVTSNVNSDTKSHGVYGKNVNSDTKSNAIDTSMNTIVVNPDTKSHRLNPSKTVNSNTKSPGLNQNTINGLKHQSTLNSDTKSPELHQRNISVVVEQMLGSMSKNIPNTDSDGNLDSDSEGIVEVTKQDMGLIKTLDDSGKKETGVKQNSAVTVEKQNAKLTKDTTKNNNKNGIEDIYADLGFTAPALERSVTAKVAEPPKWSRSLVTSKLAAKKNSKNSKQWD